MVHLVQRLHGRANLGAGYFLVEGVYEPVGARAILTCDQERVELGRQGVLLSAERQAFRHAELDRKQHTQKRGHLMEYHNRFSETSHLCS